MRRTPKVLSQRRCLTFYDKSVEEWACLSQLHVTPEYVMDFSKAAGRKELLVLSQYLHRELSVRIAHSIRDMQTLPYIVGVNPHIEMIYKGYGETFDLFKSQKQPTDWESHTEYVQLVLERYNYHANVMSTLSNGIRDIRMLPDSSRIDFQYIDSFLDRLLIQRIGRRVLSELLLRLHKDITQSEESGGERNDFLGVYKTIKPSELIGACMQQVAYLVSEQLCSDDDDLVDYEITGDVDAELTCVAQHLEYILFELCKNAAKATITARKNKSASKLPPIVFKICKGDNITIVISDQGGGIAEVSNAYSYGFSTARPSHKDTEEYMVAHNIHDSPSSIQFAGFGFGLPLSRVYARYAGGDITATSLPGYGTDIYLTLPDCNDVRDRCDWESDNIVGTFCDHKKVDELTARRVNLSPRTHHHHHHHHRSPPTCAA
eukprot:TRINITY_DN5767_c0_g1_i1.p1 TRINITY_DN5767_c0_g1~~TRINITY_DN5767_c0_g1_i1.p1  ORF type:complete len:433 (+),score=49.35 TRINITY_DN5767_c0_g1_i1:43-1341(+)